MPLRTDRPSRWLLEFNFGTALKFLELNDDTRSAPVEYSHFYSSLFHHTRIVLKSNSHGLKIEHQLAQSVGGILSQKHVLREPCFCLIFWMLCWVSWHFFPIGGKGRAFVLTIDQ